MDPDTPASTRPERTTAWASRYVGGEDLDARLGDLLAEGEALLAEARSALNHSDVSQARSLLERAHKHVDSVTDHGGKAHDRCARLIFGIRLTRTWLAFEDSTLADALKQLVALREEVVAMSWHDIAALCDMQRGSLLGRSGDPVGALAAFREAEQGRSLMAAEAQVQLLLNRSSLLSNVGELGAASVDLATAATLADVAGRADLLFMAVHNQGYAEFLRGNFPTALSLMKRADAMDVEVDRAIARLDRARVMLEAGLIDEALQVLRTALEHAAKDGSEHDRGEIELDLARCEILIGDTASARTHAATSRQRFRGRGETGWTRIALLVELEAGGLGAPSAASREHLVRTLTEAAADDLETPTRHRATLLLAEALVDQGRNAEARDALRRASSLLRSPHLATRLHTRHVSAKISAGSGQERSAVRTLKRAAMDLAAAGRQSAGLDLRTALTVHATKLIGFDLELAMRGGSAGKVLARTELWRDVIRTLPPVRTSEDPERARAIGRLRKAREDLRQVPPDMSDAALRLEVTRAEKATRELDWATEVDTDNAAPDVGPATTAQIKVAVRSAGVALLSTFISGDQWHAVLVTPDGVPSLHHLGALSVITDRIRATQADLNAAARVPPSHPMYAVVRSSLAQRLRELDSLLLTVLAEHGLADSPLVVVPTPTLSLVPWGMLPSRRGTPTTVARSVTMWARRQTEMNAQPSVYAVAGPDVPMADHEVATVIDTWGSGCVVAAEESTMAGVLAAFAQADVVHVAAHGEHHAQNPLFSSLRLRDGSLFAHEIEGRRVRASHVVLSACESGRVSVRRGDEALGMTASLLALGVSTVVAAGSPVPDDVAHSVMSDYHRNLAGGMDAASALAHATAEGDALGAAFTCFGSSWRFAKPENRDAGGA